MKALESLILLSCLIFGYWIPTINAKLRRVQGIGQVVIVNLFGFLIVPWIAALVMSFRAVPQRTLAPTPPKQPPAPHVTETEAPARNTRTWE